MNHQTFKCNVVPKKIRKFPKYNGCRTIEYIPIVLSTSALCFFVFLLEVPFGIKPIVIQWIASPKKDIVIYKI